MIEAVLFHPPTVLDRIPNQLEPAYWLAAASQSREGIRRADRDPRATVPICLLQCPKWLRALQALR